MSEDKLTPYQLKQGMTYVKNVPNFLKNLMGDHKKPDIRDKIRHDNEDDYEEEKDDFLSEKVEERPQIVVLNEEKHLNEYELKKHYVAQGKLKPEVEEVKKELKDLPEEEKTAAIDKDGRILFRSKKRKSDIENPKEGDKVEKVEKINKNNKKDTKKKKKKQVLLSFDEE